MARVAHEHALLERLGAAAPSPSAVGVERRRHLLRGAVEVAHERQPPDDPLAEAEQPAADPRRHEDAGAGDERDRREQAEAEDLDAEEAPEERLLVGLGRVGLGWVGLGWVGLGGWVL